MKKLLVTLLMFVAFFVPHSAYAADNTDLINFSITGMDKNADGTEKTTYYAKEVSNYYINIDISGKDTVLTDYYVDLFVPKKYSGSMKISPADSIQSVENLSDTLNHKYRIHLKQLTGGTTLKIPFQVNGLTRVTPDGKVIDIFGELGKDNSITKSDSIQRININRPHKLILNVENQINDNYTHFGGPLNENDHSVLSDKELKIINVSAYIEGDWDLTKRLINDQKTKYILRLPPHAHFDQALNPGWEFNAELNEVSTYGQKGLKLTFPNQPILQDIKIEALAYPEYFNQEPEEQPGVLIDPILFKLFSNIYPGDVIQKSPDLGDVDSSITNIESELNKEQRYRLYFTTSKTGPLKNVVVEDYNLDPRFELKRVDYSSGKKPFKLEAIDVNGGTFEFNLGDTLPSDIVKIKAYYGDVSDVHNTLNVYVKKKQDISLKNGDIIENTMRLTSDSMAVQNVNIVDKGSLIIKKYKPTIQLDTRTPEIKNILYQDTIYAEDRLISLKFADEHKVDWVSGHLLIPSGLELTELPGPLISKIDNFNNTGKTLYTYKIDPSKLDSSFGIPLSYRLKVNKNVQEGQNKVEHFVTFSRDNENDKKIEVSMGGKQDIYNLDNYDNTVAPYLPEMTHIYNYIPPKELIGTKHIRTNNGAWASGLM
ncbi:hypothetical protein, partial [Macrococcus capreoli]|uniref:hypothetical protein n=1 Tax=Macrococcus capreoli TaxID=2982690 RepID=UPI003EE58035